MRAIVALATILALNLGASESPPGFPPGFQSLLDNINDDDFSVREQATIELSKYPEEYIEKFLTLGDRLAREPYANAEAWYRLRLAAQGIVVRKLESDLEWRQDHGDTGVKGFFSNYCSKRRIKVGNEDPVMDTYYSYGFCREARQRLAGEDNIYGYVVSDAWGPAKDKVFFHDIITQIDGQDIGGNPFYTMEAGREYEFTVRCYRDTDKILKTYFLPDNPSYVERKVKIKADWACFDDYRGARSDKTFQAAWDAVMKKHRGDAE